MDATPLMPMTPTTAPPAPAPGATLRTFLRGASRRVWLDFIATDASRGAMFTAVAALPVVPLRSR